MQMVRPEQCGERELGKAAISLGHSRQAQRQTENSTYDLATPFVSERTWCLMK